MTEELTKYANIDLPSIQDIKHSMDNFYKEASKKPKPGNIRKNQYNNNAEYLEIGYIEAQLDRMFMTWDWVVDSVQVIANGIVVVGRLIVTTPNMVKITRSGVAGVEIQTRKGATSLAPDSMASKAMDRDPGRAEAYALKNAASKLGNAFGRGLNRTFNHEHIADESITDRIFNNTKTQNDE